MGGLWWICNTCVSPIALIIVAFFVYEDFQFYSVVLATTFYVFSGAIFLNIDRRYLATFTTTISGHEDIRNIFNPNNSDRIRLEILGYCSYSYKSIRPQVKSFVVEKWNSDWSDEKTRPDWFRKRHEKMIPRSWKQDQQQADSPSKKSQVVPV